MTDFETLFISVTDYLNRVEPRHGVSADQEINLGMLAEDFTDDIYIKLKHDFPYFHPVNNVFPNAIIFFSDKTFGEEQTHWVIKPGFTLLARFWKGKTKRIEYMGGEHIKVFPPEFFEKQGEIEYLGKTFKTPYNREQYFEAYFGPDWQTEKKDWHWGQSELHKTINEIELNEYIFLKGGRNA